MNEAMALAGYSMLSGRAKYFEKKTFLEDRWSSDESIYDKQLKMPNVKANKFQYQKEIGIKLIENPFEKENTATAVSLPEQVNKRMDGYDELREARKMLPEKPFYKIVKKDRIQIIDDY